MTEETTTAREGILKRLFEKIPEDERSKVLAALQAKRGQMPDRVTSKNASGAEIMAKFQLWNPLKASIAGALGKKIDELPLPVESFFGFLMNTSRTEIDELLREPEGEA